MHVRLLPGGGVAAAKGRAHTVRWRIEGAQEAKANLLSGQEAAYPRHNAEKRMQSAAVYEELLPGVDIQYAVMPDSFKDTLVFKNPTGRAAGGVSHQRARACADTG